MIRTTPRPPVHRTALAVVFLASPALAAGPADAPVGYYRQPAIHGDTIVFVAEGDLWKVPAAGGRATRLTSHPGDEGTPAISPDGQTIAFTAQYEGPTEVYTMPLSGGLPTRRTFLAARTSVQGWTPDGRILAATDRFSTLPNTQLFTIDPDSPEPRLIPLAQASDGGFEGPAWGKDSESGGEVGSTLYFTRLAFNGSQTKRYKGGTAQNLWKFGPGMKEAIPLTADYEGTSKRPMWSGSRLYFLTDRDGTMNIWSMDSGGKDLRQHTKHKGFDAGGAGGNSGAAIDGSRIVYQLGADLHLFDTAGGQDKALTITLDSDFDQMREHWIKKPTDYITAAHPSPDGDRIAITARGRVFVFPARQGRMVEAGRDDGVRHRSARFLPDGKSLVAMSDQSGEIEIWKLPANGVGKPDQLTTDGEVLRWDPVPSPDGSLIAHTDKNQRLWVYDAAKRTSTKIDDFSFDDPVELDWSPDSKYLAYVWWADNTFRQIKIWSAETGTSVPVTTDRFDSFTPAWSQDGKWLYFLSDRNLKSVVKSVWGPYQPDPFLDKTTKVYLLALKPGQRSPWQPKDELMSSEEDKKKEEKPSEKPAEKKEEKPADKKPAEPDKDLPAKPNLPPRPPEKPEPDKTPKKPDTGDTYKPSSRPATSDDKQPDKSSDAAESKDKDAKKDGKDAKEAKKVKVEIDFTNIVSRLQEVPLPAANYADLFLTEKALFYTTFDRSDASGKRTLGGLTITNDPIEPKTVVPDITSVEPTADLKKLLVHKGDGFYLIDAAPAPASDLEKKAVDLSGWMLSLTPRQEWRQMYREAWRLERDYFYDRDMHGVNWKAIKEKYAPLVDRVSTRAELADILAQMIGELSALHMFVRGGDLRQGDEQVPVAFLGALLSRDQAAGGYKIQKIYQSDPDDPAQLAPLAKPGVDARAGDVITMINGQSVLEAPDGAALLRNKTGKQVLIRIKPAPAPGQQGEPAERDAIVVPISAQAEIDLRYSDWEYSRRKLVEEWSGGKIGYFHMRDMGDGSFTEFARGFYPVFNREGLIIDVRHNRGGNTDSWILGKLMRKAWFFWSPRVGNPPQWNMQYAFRGHMAVLCNERTASDGEAFSEGFRRLGLGKVIGTRTWGGEIWLSSSNVLVDRGIATAAETGVYGPDGQWLIEGRGVEPDIIVDNPPHATFNGEDAQLRAAVDHLMQLIKDKPIPQANPPKKPNKSFDDNR